MTARYKSTIWFDVRNLPSILIYRFDHVKILPSAGTIDHFHFFRFDRLKGLYLEIIQNLTYLTVSKIDKVADLQNTVS